MKITDQNRQIWKDFFTTAGAFRDLKPWEWMHDTDLFGVQDPITGEIGYCCILGAAKQVFGLTVYEGAQGYHSYLKLAASYDFGKTDQITAGVNQKVLKIEFVDKFEIQDRDLEAIKALDLKFKGSRQWIQVRTMVPSYFPWYISDEQALYLTHVMWQAIDVAEKYKEASLNLETGTGELLIRIPETTEEGLIWTEKYMDEPEWEEEIMEIDQSLVDKALKLERVNGAVCYSMSYLPGGINDDDERPFFARIALWIEYGSGMIINQNILSPKDMTNFSQLFFTELMSLEVLPAQILVDSVILEDFLEPVGDALDIDIIYAPEVEAFEAVEEIQKMLKSSF